MNECIPAPPLSAGSRRTIAVHKSLLEKNAAVAQRNREAFAAQRLFVANWTSAPGAGKTLLIERLLADLGRRWRIGVIVADLATDRDAERLGRHGAPVLQLTTGTLCHLEAAMIARAVEHFRLDELDLLIIENVGNLVCPAAYDLGESLRVVVNAVTEGEDKPVKYPTMYRTADVVLLNKIDLADAAGFDWPAGRRWLAHAAPQARVFDVSARTGAGMATWHEYLDTTIRRSRGD